MNHRSRGELALWLGGLVLLLLASTLAHAAPPAFSKAFQPSTIGPGSVSTLVFTISNQGQPTPASNLGFADTLPSGMTLASPAQTRTDCVGATIAGSDGGSSLTLSDGTLGAESICHVYVEVTVASPGSYTNTSGDLTSDQGNSGTASATLMVEASRPGFSKAFAPAMIGVNQTSTLTFTLDNSANGSGVFSLHAVDTLPPGLQIASPANLISSCPGNSFVDPGTGSISLSLSYLPANTVCEISLDVLATVAGKWNNLTDILDSSVGQSGKAAASLDVRLGVLAMAFVDDPLPPGSSGTLRFTISNLDRDDAMGDIAFTDDLDASLSGLVATGLPQNDVCGAGSTISGSGTLSLNGGHLAPGATCSFDVSVQVPAGALSGAYPNTTSSLTFNRAGTAQSADPANDSLTVATYPLLSKQFTDDPVVAGGIASMEFTLTNSDLANPASNIRFQDYVEQMLPGTSFASLPPDGFCGTGSSATQSNPFQGRLLTVQGASLPAGGSCTFTVSLQISADAHAGTYTNTTESVSATVGSETFTGPGASGTLVVAAAPRLRKAFVDNPMDVGGTGTLEFTLTADDDAAGASSNIAFTDDLDATLGGLNAVALPSDGFCGPASHLSGTSLLSLSGAELAAGESCTFQVTVQVPAGAVPGTYTNTTSSVSATQLGLAVNSAPASAPLVVNGLTLSKSFTDDPAIAGGTVTLHFELSNASATGDYSNISFSDNLNSVLPGLVATGLPTSNMCGSGSQISGTSVLVFTGGSVPAGTSCAFDVTLQIPGTAGNGEYGNTTSSVTAEYAGNPQTLAPARDTLRISDALYLSKHFVDDPVAPGDPVILEFTLENGTSQAASGISFSDDLDAALSGLVAVGLPQNDVCGSGSSLTGTSTITLTGGSLPASANCTFQVTLQVPASASVNTPVVNTTSAVSAMINGSTASGAPASDTLALDNVAFNKSFNSAAGAGQSVDLTFTLQNLSTSTSSTGLRFVDDLDAMLPGSSATGLPVNDICGSGSTLTGGSSIALSNASLAAGASCSFTVSVQIPASAAPGSYPNTTSELTRSGLHAAAPAGDTLEIEPAPVFDKNFSPATTGVGIPSTLRFNIDNSASVLAADNLAFVDNLPAGMTVAATPNASSSCTGGTFAGTAGSNTVSLAGASVAAGATCAVQIDVTSSTTGGHLNTSGNLTSTLGNSGTASATLTVLPAPTFGKAFSPDTIATSGTSTLTFTIDNSANSQGATALAFSDNFPAGMSVASPANAGNSCGGTFSAPDGAASVSLSGGSVAAASTCTLQVDVTAGPVGSYHNVSSSLSSSLGVSGGAEANLTVLPPLLPPARNVPTLDSRLLALLALLIGGIGGWRIRRKHGRRQAKVRPFQ